MLYDSQADSAGMENHLEREEVRQALETGHGESSRYSKTLSEELLYCAELLPDGTVIRLSSVRSTVLMLLLGFAQPIAIVAVLALALSFWLASRLSKKIIEPINALDPDKPSDYIGKEAYTEIEPLLLKMRAQQNEIAKIRRSWKNLADTAGIHRQRFARIENSAARNFRLCRAS